MGATPAYPENINVLRRWSDETTIKNSASTIDDSGVEQSTEVWKIHCDEAHQSS